MSEPSSTPVPLGSLLRSDELPKSPKASDLILQARTVLSQLLITLNKQRDEIYADAHQRYSEETKDLRAEIDKLRSIIHR